MFPLWSLNAFAYSGAPGGNGIAIGDGITQFFGTVGLEDIGPDYVLFHEMAHHIQYESGTFDNSDNWAEGSRKSELMADYLAAYYAFHSRGGTFESPARLEKVAAAAFNTGDCDFYSFDHHGTPNQRAKAVEFAVDLIDSMNDSEQILSTAEVIGAFNERYEELVAPDAN